MPGGPQVRELLTQHGIGLGLVFAGQSGMDPGGELHCPTEQAPGRGVVLASRHEPVEAEGAHRRQHAVAGTTQGLGVHIGVHIAVTVSVDDVGVDDSASIIEASTRPASTLPGSRHAQDRRRAFGVIEVDAVDEDRQVPEQPPFVVGRAAGRTTRWSRAGSGAVRRRWACRRRAGPASGRAGGAGRPGRSVDSRPAASSMASGIPSSRRTMSATTRSSAAPAVDPAGPGRPCRGTPRRRGPAPVMARRDPGRCRREPARAAAPAGRRTRRPARAAPGWWPARSAAGQLASTASTMSRTASSRCSQLSIISRPGLSPSTARQALRTSPWVTVRFSAAASACGMVGRIR